ncbi:MAG: hypothetical protein DI538_14235 [Azospira oryzae]|jgi:hypothetical protein|nr:MAG: hypothetical protein DI538_14235 [Azospira oryzae]
MKKVMALVIMLGASVVMFAQGYQKNVKLKQEEVPVAVVQAFQNDFSSISGELTKGSWSVNAEEKNGVLKPITYAYKAKRGDAKFEARYTPDGTLDSAKGSDKDKSSSGEKK